MVTAEMVKALREKTGAGMLDCKKALNEANGDEQAAVEILRKKGAATAAKRADRDANMGKVLLAQTASRAVAIEANCETEPVGNLDEFNSLAKECLQLVMDNAPADLDALNALKLSNGETIHDAWEQLTGKIGEKMGIRRFAVLEKAANEVVGLYSHMGGKIGVLVKMSVEGAEPEKAAELAKNTAMQVAAFAPIAIRPSEIDPELVAKEREIYREQAAQAGTKPEFVDRQVEGRLGKYYTEVCLEEQSTAFDAKKSCKQLIAEVAKEIGASKIEVKQFVRFALGK